VNFEKYVIKTKLGQGATAKVYKVVKKNNFILSKEGINQDSSSL
jgi:hypothetical protein